MTDLQERIIRRILENKEAMQIAANFIGTESKSKTNVKYVFVGD